MSLVLDAWEQIHEFPHHAVHSKMARKRLIVAPMVIPESCF